MEIIVVKDYLAVCTLAATLVARQIKAKPDSVLGLPTGRTPEAMYKKLVDLFSKGVLNFDQVRTFNLDDYVGIDQSHPDSYYSYMKKNLFSLVNLRSENIYFPNGDSADLADECADYERSIDSVGGIDLLILGIGHNGHLGFCEPGTSFASKTHLVDLSEDTRTINKELMSELSEVPEQAISMGIGTMLKARSIILLASGASKQVALKSAFYGPVTEKLPASVLQTHPDVIVIMDDAASLD